MDIRKRRVTIITKWVIYVLLFMLCAVLQTTPGFLTIGSVKPMFILPLCLAVALCEGEFSGALFGAAGGLVWDMLAGRVIGFFAIGVMLCSFAVSILAQLYLKENNTNFTMLTAAAAFIITGYDFLFRYLMTGYSSAAEHYLSITLPIIVFTSVLSPILLITCKKISARFTLEE